MILAYSSVMARYIFRMSTITPSDWQLKGVAVGCYTLAIVGECDNPGESHNSRHLEQSCGHPGLEWHRGHQGFDTGVVSCLVVRSSVD
jgi:hypothetical protein